MAKRAELKDRKERDSVYRKTDDKPGGGKNNVWGVYLNKDNLTRIDKIKDTVGISRGRLLRYAVLDFVRRYEAGEIQIETEKRVKMPDLD